MNLLSSLNRRDFVRCTSVGIAGAALGFAQAATAASRKKIPVGLQLYSLREQCKTDLPGMLTAVAKIGYKGVEFAGYHGRSAEELRKMLDDNGLVACGTHTPYDSVLGDKLKETVEFNHTIGNKFLIVPWMQAKTKQEWLDKAKLFNEIADQGQAPTACGSATMPTLTTSSKIDGVSAWDLFFGNTKPEVVMQLDTSNCLEGGADPVAVLKKYPGRARSIHLKAHGGGPEAVIGEDKVEWKEVFAFCETKGKTQWYIVEHESSKNPLDAVKRSYDALKTMGKV